MFLLLGSLVTPGNVIYVLLFGWWISLFYFLVSLLMFCTIAGIPYGMLGIFCESFVNSPFQLNFDTLFLFESVLSYFMIGKLCLQLSLYFVWPFGKALQKVSE